MASNSSPEIFQRLPIGRLALISGKFVQQVRNEEILGGNLLGSFLIHTKTLDNDLVVDIEDSRTIAKLVAGGGEELEMAPCLLEIMIQELSAQAYMIAFLLG